MEYGGVVDRYGGFIAAAAAAPCVVQRITSSRQGDQSDLVESARSEACQPTMRCQPRLHSYNIKL